jgi:hypothetical protein
MATTVTLFTTATPPKNGACLNASRYGAAHVVPHAHGDI